MQRLLWFCSLWSIVSNNKSQNPLIIGVEVYKPNKIYELIILTGCTQFLVF